jgi:hypothetical protein
MQRFWYLAHAVASLIAAKISFSYIHPDPIGRLNAKSQAIFACINGFYVVQAILAVLLFFLLRRTRGPLNGALSFLALLWTGVMFTATQFAAITL